MKVRVGRQIDLPDIALLQDSLGLRTAKAVCALHDRVFPGDPIPAGSLNTVRRFLSAHRQDGRSLDSGSEDAPSC